MVLLRLFLHRIVHLGAPYLHYILDSTRLRTGTGQCAGSAPASAPTPRGTQYRVLTTGLLPAVADQSRLHT